MKRFEKLGAQIVFAVAVAGLLLALGAPFFFKTVPRDPEDVLKKARIQTEAGAIAAGNHMDLLGEMPNSIEDLINRKMLSTSIDEQNLKLTPVSKRAVVIEYQDPALQPPQRERVARKTSYKIEWFPGTETAYAIYSR